MSIINEACNLLHISTLLRKVESQVSGTTEIQDEPGANVLFARMVEWIPVHVAIISEPPQMESRTMSSIWSKFTCSQTDSWSSTCLAHKIETQIGWPWQHLSKTCNARCRLSCSFTKEAIQDNVIREWWTIEIATNFFEHTNHLSNNGWLQYNARDKCTDGHQFLSIMFFTAECPYFGPKYHEYRHVPTNCGEISLDHVTHL